MKPTKKKIEQLRKKHPEIDEYVDEVESRNLKRNNKHYEERSMLEERIRNLEAALRVQEIINEALKVELHSEYESFLRRAISFAEQY
jgi:transcription elongation GreA/GreB family factor